MPQHQLRVRQVRPVEGLSCPKCPTRLTDEAALSLHMWMHRSQMINSHSMPAPQPQTTAVTMTTTMTTTTTMIPSTISPPNLMNLTPISRPPGNLAFSNIINVMARQENATSAPAPTKSSKRMLSNTFDPSQISLPSITTTADDDDGDLPDPEAATINNRQEEAAQSRAATINNRQEEATPSRPYPTLTMAIYKMQYQQLTKVK